jgi:hypothetical protein
MFVIFKGLNSQFLFRRTAPDLLLLPTNWEPDGFPLNMYL